MTSALIISHCVRHGLHSKGNICIFFYGCCALKFRLCLKNGNEIVEVCIVMSFLIR